MLYIYINSGESNNKEFEGHVSAYFDDVYEPEWFQIEGYRR